jgi:hypothetical protein
LNFDVVSDASIEKRCGGSLWPYNSKGENQEQQQLQGTRCGVFPLPSNLSIHNLYAILIVHKVISDGDDFEVYLKKKENIDIGLLRGKAEKASKRHGPFIMPFAFGVAPLLQVFGADVPVVPSSRAVQIPLFRFAAGHGERQIIDHIMVMLYPRYVQYSKKKYYLSLSFWHRLIASATNGPFCILSTFYVFSRHSYI